MAQVSPGGVLCVFYTRPAPEIYSKGSKGNQVNKRNNKSHRTSPTHKTRHDKAIKPGERGVSRSRAAADAARICNYDRENTKAAAHHYQEEEGSQSGGSGSVTDASVPQMEQETSRSPGGD